MKTWKRNAIIAGVLVLVCAGIYLNWSSGHKTPELTDSLDADKIMNDATLVLNGADEAQEVLGTPTGDEAFAQMRLSRQTTRDQAVTLLQETISYAEGGDTIAGEVSAVNDDTTDNVFLAPSARFTGVEEDEPAVHYLVTEYV